MFFLFLLGFGYPQAIFVEDFESAAFPPLGWKIIHTSGTQTWTRSNIYYQSGSWSAFHDFATGGLQESALITPPITLPNYGTPTLEFGSRFWLVGFKYCGVLISTTHNTTLEAFTEIRKITAEEGATFNWLNISVPLDNYLGQTVYIAFLYSGNDGNRWFIDNVSIMHLASFVDIQPFGITPISGNYPLFSTNEQITVRLKNNGGAPASGFNLKLFDNGNLKITEPFTGSIPSGDETTYTFNTTLNLSAAGMHKVQVVTNLIGDQISANDTATSMLNNLGCNIVSTFPFFEGFENNGNNLPSCWTQEYVAKNFNWRVFNASSAQSTTFEPKTAFEGDYKAVFYTNGKDGAITKLITPPMNITTMNNPVLKFHHIQKYYSGDQDSLKIYYKTSAHAPWVFLEKYTETLESWTERILPLPEPSTQYYIAFEAYAEYGASVQIDAITIDDYFEKDIAVMNITPKGVHVGLSNQEIITVTLKNNGRAPITGFDVSLYCNENIISNEIYPHTIPGLGEVNYTFNTKVDLSVSGYYSLTVVADLVGDEVPNNNELSVIVKNLVCDALTFPYDEGFEEETFPPHCWSKVGEWKRTPYSAHNGMGRASHSWWDGLLGWLISPKFSLPANGDFILEFWSHVYDKKYFTYSGVWISTTNNNPSSFVEVLGLSGDLTPDEVWKRIEVPLSAYSGKDIYIAFKYTNSGGQSGHIWSIDDVNIFNLNNFIDAEVVEITAPPSLDMNMTNTEPITVKIKNNGGDKMNGFKLILECNGAVVATENYTGYITSLATANYTFNTKLNLSAAGTYSIKVTIVLEDDMNLSNNFKTKTVENRVCPAVTSFPWYGEFQGSSADGFDECWLNIDSDGDTKKWFSLQANGKYYAISESHDAVYNFSLTPDNWFITPPLLLNQVCTLSYKVGGANSEHFGAEKYSVLISKIGVNLVGFTALRTETLYPSDYTESLIGVLSNYGVKTVKVPLNSFIGETVHIAFRHWDCTSQDKLIITDINVGKELSVTDVSGDNNPLRACIYNDKLYIYRLNPGDDLNVYAVWGQLVHRSVVHNETENIKLNARGVYIVKSGNRIVKVIF